MDAFISYRRDTGIDFAARLNERFSKEGYDCFFDVERMRSGRFDKQLYSKIEQSTNFIIVLSPNALDRCKNRGDWVRLELEKAIALNKNIVPVFMPKFSFPDDMPDTISVVSTMQGVNYVHGRDGFNKLFAELLSYMVDEEGRPLVDAKKAKKSNTYYETVGMSEAEKERIVKDYTICKEIESKIFNDMLTGRSDLVAFNPAIYEISSAMEKYSYFPQISHIYGFVCNQSTADEANDQYGQGRNKFYAGNMEDADFETKMDAIIKEHNLTGFDFVDLTLILKDSPQPFERLTSIVDRLNPNAIVYIRELDDDMVMGFPDEQEKFKHLVELLSVNKYAGNRHMGRSVLTFLHWTGASEVKMYDVLLSSAGMSTKRKRMLFDTYFSYLEPEIDDLISKYPDNDKYRNAKSWLVKNYASVKQSFQSKESLFISGFMFFYGIYKDKE